MKILKKFSGIVILIMLTMVNKVNGQIYDKLVSGVIEGLGHNYNEFNFNHSLNGFHIFSGPTQDTVENREFNVSTLYQNDYKPGSCIGILRTFSGYSNKCFLVSLTFGGHSNSILKKNLSDTFDGDTRKTKIIRNDIPYWIENFSNDDYQIETHILEEYVNILPCIIVESKIIPK